LRSRARGGRKKVAQAPERYEMHYQDETHLETNPYLCKIWHRVGEQPTLPAVGTNRRVRRCLGAWKLSGVGEWRWYAKDTTALASCATWRCSTGGAERRNEMFLVLDNGSCHTSKASRAALAERGEWLRVVRAVALQPAPEPQGRSGSGVT